MRPHPIPQSLTRALIDIPNEPDSRPRVCPRCFQLGEHDDECKRYRESAQRARIAHARRLLAQHLRSLPRAERDPVRSWVAWIGWPCR